MYSGTTPTTSWESRYILKYGELYRVSVSTVTYTASPSVSTRVKFIASGKREVFFTKLDDFGFLNNQCTIRHLF